MRCGWLVAPEEVLCQFNVAKQAADLHSNHLCQLVLHRWLTTHDLDVQCRRVAGFYEENCRALVDALEERCPELTHTTPEGGMFMLARLPRGISSLALFEEGIRQGVAVMPGPPFYLEGGDDVVRLNFSNTDPERCGGDPPARQGARGPRVKPWLRRTAAAEVSTAVV